MNSYVNKLTVWEKYCLLCLYFVACVHYSDSLIMLSLYIVLPSAFAICCFKSNTYRTDWGIKHLYWLYFWILFCALFTSDWARTSTHLKQLIGCVCSTYVIASIAKDSKRVRLAYVSFLLFLISTWQYAMGHLYEVMDLGTSQLSDESNKLNANTFAYFTFYATFIIYILGDMNFKFAKHMKYIFPFTLVLSFATAIFSSSRQVLLIQIPFIIFLLFNRYNIKSSKKIIAFSFIIIAAVLGYSYIGESIFANSYLAHRAEANIEEDSRILIARECWKLGKDNMLLGVGPGCVSKYISTGNFSHNTYLELFAGTGIVSVILFCLLLFGFIKNQLRRWKLTRDSVYMSFIIFGIFWAVDQVFYVFHTGLWLISFFILVICHSNVYTKENYPNIV